MTDSDATRPTLGHRLSAPVERRTLIRGAAWSIPAIALATTTPAHAASGATLAFTQAPTNVPGCGTISTPIVVHLHDSPASGQLVQISLPSGWTWTSGSGSYTTDANGDATVPANSIAVDNTSGSIAATASGLTATASVTVDHKNTLKTNQSSYSFPSGSSTDIARLYASGKGITVARRNGDVWSWYNEGAWTQVGAGADTGVGQLTFIDATSTQASLWIKAGVLQVGSVAAAIPSGSNSDFVRVAASGPIALAVRSNGDLWQWTDGQGWVLAATSVDTGANQIACLAGQPRTAPYWISGGVLFSDAGVVNMGSAVNSGILRVYAARGYDANGGNLAVITSTGDAWSFSEAAGWVLRDSGVDTGAEMSAVRVVGRSNGGVWTIKSGVVRGTPNSPTGTNVDYFGSTTSAPFGELITNESVTLLTRADGSDAYYYDARYLWSDGNFSQLTTDVGVGPGQIAMPVTNGWNSPSFWTGNLSC